MSEKLETKRPGRPKKKESAMSLSAKNYFKVYRLLKEKPYKVIEIKEKTNLSNSTIYNIIDGLISEGFIKSTGDSMYVDINYDYLEEEIEKWLKKKYQKRFPFKHVPESITKTIATMLGKKDDEKFKEAFVKVCNKYNIRIFTNI